jgi:hypothetical protein
MPRAHAVIDIAADPLAAAVERRRTSRRIGIPVLSVVLMSQNARAALAALPQQ